MTNRLFYGDNLDVLRNRETFPDASIDLIYLDPPFNSDRAYAVIFASPDGKGDEGQIEAFKDSFTWADKAEDAFDQVMRSGNTQVADLLRTMLGFLGRNNLMAYLTMMAIRLLELHRILKPTGSLYLHCDPTASHYIKLLLDGVFGKENLRNEIIWCYRRYTAQSNRFQRLHDVIFFYGKSATITFNNERVAYGDNSGKRDSHYKQDDDGRWFRWQKRKGAEPYKIFLSEGVRLGDWWDIPPINASSKERLGYPTQKPLALLERIIAASSNPGDVVLDPFCGCGTAVHAAEKLGRRWMGIDITHLAIALIERRMRDAFPAIEFTIEGRPTTLAGALDLARRDKYQFQWWAVAMLDAVPFKGRKKGPDGGIDGLIYCKPDGRTTERAIVSVKGGTTTGVAAVETLAATIERESAPIGVLLMAAPPTREMEKRAAAVGVLRDAAGRSFPRLQIITLAELFRGKRPAIPYVDTAAGFRQAERENTEAQDGFDL